jgi:hypothetical protein
MQPFLKALYPKRSGSIELTLTGQRSLTRERDTCLNSLSTELETQRQNAAEYKMKVEAALSIKTQIISNLQTKLEQERQDAAKYKGEAKGKPYYDESNRR